MAIATKKRPSGKAHRKRTGTHHRHSKPYLKTYWPYIPMLGIVGIGLAVNAMWTQSGVLGSRSNFNATSLLNSTNQQRRATNGGDLRINDKLAVAAQTKANEMAAENYWAHTSPSGQTAWNIITGAGYSYQLAGENLAYGFSDASGVVTGWMTSPEHRANMLDSRYSDVGFGVATTPNFQNHGPTTIVVAEYAQPNNGQPTTPAVQALRAVPITRIEILTDRQAWSFLAVSLLTFAASFMFVLQHGYRLQRVLNRGEAFIAKHPYVDIAVVLIIVTGIVLTRSSGFIH